MQSITAVGILIGLLSPMQTARPTPLGDAAATSEDKVADSALPRRPGGLWPSDKLMHLMLARWADTVSEQMELDDAQRVMVRERITKRWGEFLEGNREGLQPLVNEYLELRMELEPPEKERVQAWAKRAMPVFERLRTELDDTVKDVRGVMNPEQKAQFEMQALELGVGMEVVGQKLRQWQSGSFDGRDFWIPTGKEQRRDWARNRREQVEKAKETVRKQVTGAETDQIGAELVGWEAYVAEFMDHYVLDDGQRDAALSLLKEMKERAITHRDSRREAIDDLERRIRTNTGSEEEVAEIKASLVELYGPIDGMFRELKARLEAIPSSAQRAAHEPAANDNAS